MSVHEADDDSPTKPHNPSTPRRSPAVRRTPNGSLRKDVSANKASTPQSAPARPRTGAKKKPEATLLGDFLLGRPSASRTRRKSSGIVHVEMKTSAVNKLQPPGGVKDRVKQWQKASAAAVIDDPLMPANEPGQDDDNDDANDQNTRHLDVEILPKPKLETRKNSSPIPARAKGTPKKRVVSDSHWMKKDIKSQPKKPDLLLNIFVDSTKMRKGPMPKARAAKGLPKDFVETNWANPPLERKIQDWANRTAGHDLSTKDEDSGPISRKTSHANGSHRSSPKEALPGSIARSDSSSVTGSDDTSKAESAMHNDINDGIRVRPIGKKRRKRNASIEPADEGSVDVGAKEQLARKRSIDDGIRITPIDGDSVNETGKSSALNENLRRDNKKGMPQTDAPGETVNKGTLRGALKQRSKHDSKTQHVSASKTKKQFKTEHEPVQASSISSTSSDDDEDLRRSDDRLHPSHKRKVSFEKSAVEDDESLADIPVGFSAFSVLDLAGGRDVRWNRPSKPQRKASLVTVPKVLKKVYNEGMKMVQDTVDPPRIVINQPASIESWLNGTSDPFVDNCSKPENVVHIKGSRAYGRSRHEGGTSHGARQGNSEGEEEESSMRRTRIRERSSLGRSQGQNLMSKRTDASGVLKEKQTPQSMDGEVQHGEASLAPSLRRTPAKRNASSPIFSRKTFAKERVVRNPSKPSLSSNVEIDLSSMASTTSKSKESRSLYNSENGMGDEDSGHSRTSLENTVDDKIPPGSSRLSTQSHPDAPHSHSPSRSSLVNERELPTPRRSHLPTTASVETLTTYLSQTETASSTSRTSTNWHSSNMCCPSKATDTASSISTQVTSPSGIKRRLTKHSDLMSMLSLPDTALPPGRSATIISARSIPTRRTSISTGNIAQILAEVATDEETFMRELRTLVDGVIPVLLSSVLSKSESAVASRFLGSPSDQTASTEVVTKPIVDMGIALERLKNLHRRISVRDVGQFLHWASGAYDVYDDYLTAWRLEFDDLVVNLAPATLTTDDDKAPYPADVYTERVDVAHLLKRPLSRVRYLAKAAKVCMAYMKEMAPANITKGLSLAQPSQESELINKQFQCLLDKVRRRTKEENARKQDRLANNTDPTRARDVRTLASLKDVHIDRTRQVKAKEFFDFDLQHSNGQRMACEIEVIVRDSSRGAGDILICEVDDRHNQWLLFPPIDLDRISARKGELPKDLIVMIRGFHDGMEWREHFILKAEQAEIADEFVMMLGSEPMPPLISRFDSQSSPDISPENPLMSGALPCVDSIDVPIGEEARFQDLVQRTSVRTESHHASVSDHVLPKVQKTPEARHASSSSYQDAADIKRQSTTEEISKSIQKNMRTNSSPHMQAANLASKDLPLKSKAQATPEMFPGKNTIDSTVSGTSSPSAAVEIPALGSSAHSPSQMDEAPPPPVHRHKISRSLGSDLPAFSIVSSGTNSRRSSSPLKYEYQPSQGSATSLSPSSSDSYDTDSNSDFSHDDELEPETTAYSMQSRSSDLLPTSLLLPKQNSYCLKFLAHISCWRVPPGRWDDLQSEFCSIVVTPGLIEAFVLNASHSSPEHSQSSKLPNQQPLVALVLTPVVMIRQSNALDIEIHSPPLQTSLLKCSHIVRFRSRSDQDCRGLYAATYKARQDNEQYKRLQQQRILSDYGRHVDQATGDGKIRHSWFGRKKSYRASGRASSAAGSDGSAFSLGTAFLALKRMSNGGSFNIDRSSLNVDRIHNGAKSRGSSLYTTSDSASSGFTPPRTPTDPSLATTGTIDTSLFDTTNLIIRLYRAETSSQWVEIGLCRITIGPAPPGMRQASSLYTGIPKRVTLMQCHDEKPTNIINRRFSIGGVRDENKSPSIYFDGVLGSRCFSRVQRVGIVMNVWEEMIGPNGEIGMAGAVGGVSGRQRKWMFQCSNSSQARWIFALLGGGV